MGLARQMPKTWPCVQCAGRLMAYSKGMPARQSCCGKNSNMSARWPKFERNRPTPSGDLPRSGLNSLVSATASPNGEIKYKIGNERLVQSDGERRAQAAFAPQEQGRATAPSGGGDRRRLLRAAIQNGPGRRPGESRHHGRVGECARRGRSEERTFRERIASWITATTCKKAASKSRTQMRSLIAPAARVSPHDGLFRALWRTASAVARSRKTEGEILCPGAETAGRTQELNEAFRFLSDPRLRVRHLLELEGAELKAGRDVPATVVDLFWNSGTLLRAIDHWLVQNAQAKSTLSQALLHGEKTKLETRLKELEQELSSTCEREVEQLRQMTISSPLSPNELKELVQRHDATFLSHPAAGTGRG